MEIHIIASPHTNVLDLTSKDFSVLLLTELVVDFVLAVVWSPKLILFFEELLLLSAVFSVFLSTKIGVCVCVCSIEEGLGVMVLYSVMSKGGEIPPQRFGKEILDLLLSSSSATFAPPVDKR